MNNHSNPHADRVGGAADWLEYQLKHVHGLTDEDLQKMADRRRAVAQYQLEMYQKLQAQSGR